MHLLQPEPQEAEALAGACARFLAETVSGDAAYISHGEYFEGLSPDGRQWAGDLEARYHEMFAEIFRRGDRSRPVLRAVSENGQILALAIGQVADNGTERYLVIEDMAVASTARRTGLGAAILDRFAEIARQQGCARLVLESGVDNHGAHALFGEKGFDVFSKVFTRSL